MNEPRPLSPQEYARRLIRSRNWHLVQAGRMRRRAVALYGDVRAHEREADLLEAEIRALGFDPQPPRNGPTGGPRAA